MKFKFISSISDEDLKMAEFMGLKFTNISKRADGSREVELIGDKDKIRAIVTNYGDELTKKIFNAKLALEELVEEVNKYHGCKGYGTSKSVLIPLELDDYVTDHFALFENSQSHQGIQVTSYEYEWINPNEE